MCCLDSERTAEETWGSLLLLSCLSEPPLFISRATHVTQAPDNSSRHPQKSLPKVPNEEEYVVTEKDRQQKRIQ